jgi:hypothetical protein
MTNERRSGNADRKSRPNPAIELDAELVKDLEPQVTADSARGGASGSGGSIRSLGCSSG